MLKDPNQAIETTAVAAINRRGNTPVFRQSRRRIGDIAEILLDYFENNKTFQTDKLMTVPAESYADSNVLRTEIDAIFKRLPLMLALTCELPKLGDYKAMEVAGLPVLIARDKSGTLRAFFNVCAHRWAPVAAEGRGNCSRFVCPFHGWTYDTDGRLTGVADRAKFGDIDRSAHGLKQLPCEERHGMIFVCLTPGTALDLDGYYEGLLEEFADAGLKDWTFLGCDVLEGPNWKLVLTNFLESYHFATQHAKSGVNTVYVSNVNHYEAFGPNMRGGYVKHEIAKLREVPRAQWAAQEGPAFTFQRFLFPNVIGTLGNADASAFAQILPGPTPDKSRVVMLFLQQQPPKDEDERASLERDLKNADDDVLRREDFATGFATQKGLHSGAHDGFLFGRNERGPQYFHEWVDWYLKGDATQPKPVL